MHQRLRPDHMPEGLKPAEDSVAKPNYERIMNSKEKRQVNLTLPGRLNQKLNSLDDGFWFYLSGLNYDNIYDDEA